MSWSSGDESIAIVDADGNVTAIATGSVGITASSTDTDSSSSAIKNTYNLIITDAVVESLSFKLIVKPC